MIKRVILLNILLLLISCTAPMNKENTVVFLKTSLGDIKIKLYDGTPLHRDNFIKLVKTGYYDGISFHRIIQDFMIQAGDPVTKTDLKKALPDSMETYTIPAEITQQYFHKKGALAAAREGNDVNPEMRSSGTQFYIVQGVKLNDDELNQMELRINSNIKQALFNRLLKETSDSANASGTPVTPALLQELASMKMYNHLAGYKEFKVPAEQREVYKNTGGVPRLDGTYTVFGEVIEGLDVVDKIAAVQTDATDKPVNDVKILKVKLVKN